MDPQPWRLLGDAHTADGHPDEALRAYNQAVSRGDTSSALERSLAYLHVVLGDPHRAIQHLNRYLTHRPDDRAAKLLLAQLNIWAGDWDHATMGLTQLVENDTGDNVAQAWLEVLSMVSDAGSDTLASERITQEPTLLGPILEVEALADASADPAYRSGLLGAAVLELDITTLSATEPSGRLGRQAIEAAEKARLALAVRSLLSAVYYDPGYADAYAYLGQALDQLGWSDWALASLKRALQLAPQSPIVLAFTGLYWDRHASLDLARYYYEQAYRQDGENVALCFEIAASYATAGEYTAAEVWLLNAVRIDPNNPMTWQMLAHFYLDSGIGADGSGLAAANRLLELVPNSAQAHDLLGWAYFLVEEDEQSEARLVEALALDPTLASAHFHLGRLHARQGRYAEAAQDYRRAADCDIEGQWSWDLERAWSEVPPDYRPES
jgi:tetratricopeptide (TPR) repeat protein